MGHGCLAEPGVLRCKVCKELKLDKGKSNGNCYNVVRWVVVKIMGSCWIPIIIRHLISRVPKKGP